MILISSKEEVRVSHDALDEPGRSKLNAGGRLDSWKEIAAYLGRSVRSVQRWERAEGLPVLRHQHVKFGDDYLPRKMSIPVGSRAGALSPLAAAQREET
jgi:hypothetical protein